MQKRTFLKLSSIMATGLMLSPLEACKTAVLPQKTAQTPTAAPAALTFSLPALPYAYNSLAPMIDAATMEIHHSKHHAAYINNLNTALQNAAHNFTSLEDLMHRVERQQTTLRNNGGGHYNHSLFWQCLTPGATAEPQTDLATAINQAFGSFDTFKKQFTDAAKSVFGSGWVWLAVNDSKQLYICTTANQDNPLMRNVADKPGTPILGLDVWEHAYYLQYQNSRAEYIENFFKLIHWGNVSGFYQQALKA